jgi:hypothetical protein
VVVLSDQRLRFELDGVLLIDVSLKVDTRKALDEIISELSHRRGG